MLEERSIIQERLNKAKFSYTTRRVPIKAINSIKYNGWSPKAGDLILAKVEKIGQHTRIELPDGRKAQLFPGDEIVIACGNRYATDQFEAILDTSKKPTDMVAAGGIASNVVCSHDKMKPATQLEPLGLLLDEHGNALNLIDFKIPKLEQKPPIKTIVVAGTSMNSGKTTTAASIVLGLTKAGHNVGYAKLTGTGAGGDPWLMKDCGAHKILDFTDVGYASTYLLSTSELESLSHQLINHIAEDECDIAVVEIADGIQHFETKNLLSCQSFQLRTHGVFFASYDSMGAIQGIQWLKQAGYNVLGLSGVITASSLAKREAKEQLKVPVVSPSDLRAGNVAADLCLNIVNMAKAI